MPNTVPPLVLRIPNGAPLTSQQGDGNLTILVNFLNALAASVGVSLNPDGTLVAGALNNVNQILDGVITAAKLAPNTIYSGGDIRNTLSSTAYSTIADEGWLECDGSQVSRTVFLNLWKVLGGGADIHTGSSPWGNGDGTTTFLLPDFRGRAFIGVGAGAGLTLRNRGDNGGAETHLLTVAQIPPHTHDEATLRISASGNVADPAGGIWGYGSGYPQTTGNGTGGGLTHNNMQPWAAVRYLIKT